MTTEASSLTALLTQDREAPLTQIRVGGVEIPFLELELMQGETGDEASFTLVSKYAGQLHVNNAVEICFSGEPVFTGLLLLAHVREDDYTVCRAVSLVTADPPLWERYFVARSRL